MNRAEIIGRAESVLKTAGFNVSQVCCSRPSCFDVVARRKNQLAFIKSHENIGNISMMDALELKNVSNHLFAAALLVCEKTRHKPMEDDTIYSRYGIYAITPPTLEAITVNGNNPLVDASPGGYYVRLDGEKIRTERQKRSLSVGKLAEMTGISRRTLYGYEKSMARASVNVAYELEFVLGVPLVKEIDVFQRPPEQDKGFLAAAKRLISLHHCLRSVEHKLAKFNVFVAHIKRAPFDFIAESKEKKFNIIGGVTIGKERNLEQRINEIVSVGEVLGLQPVLVAEKVQEPISNNDITCIPRDELENINDLEELRRLF